LNDKIHWNWNKSKKKKNKTLELKIISNNMKNLTIYLSTAPVVALGWFAFTAGFLIEINRFFPDPLIFSF